MKISSLIIILSLFVISFNASAKNNLLEIVCEKNNKQMVQATINLIDLKQAELVLDDAGIITRCPLSVAAIFDKRQSQTFSATIVLDKNTLCEAKTKFENEIENPIKIMMYFKGNPKPQSARVFWLQNNAGPECTIKNIDLKKMKLD